MRSKSRFFLLFVVLMILALSTAMVAGCGEDTTETTATTADGGTETTAATTETTTAQQPPEADVIKFGAARPISGVFSFFEENAFGPVAKMWIDEVNAAGGINVAGKMMPIEYTLYDDQSNLDNAMRLLEKLIVEDKVDFIFAPQSTAFLFAGAGVANAHGKLLISAEGGATSLEKEVANLPLFFQVLNYSNHYQVPALAKIMQEKGVKTAAVIYIDDLHGIEYAGVAEEELPKVGVEIVSKTAVPADIKDISTVLKQIQELNPDALLCCTYPDINFLIMAQIQQLGYSPPMMVLGPGGSFQFFYNAHGPAMDGVMAWGAWSKKSSPEAQALFDKLVAYMGTSDNIDYWGHILYYAELQMLQQAIEKAGTLDNAAVAEVLKTEHFQTILGDTFFTNQFLDESCYAGQIGQWQNGEFEVIDVGEKRTADPIYPKPDWPAPAAQ